MRYGTSSLQDEEGGLFRRGGKRKSLGLVVMSRSLGHHIFKLNNYEELVSPDLTTGHVGGFSLWTYWHEITSDVPGGDLHSMSRDNL